MKVLQHVDPLLGNKGEISKYTRAITEYKHVPMETTEQQQRNSLFYVVQAEMLQPGQLEQ
jgi:hypothetical protein